MNMLLNSDNDENTARSNKKIIISYITLQDKLCINKRLGYGDIPYRDDPYMELNLTV